MQQSIQRKLKRLRAGEPPRVLDLFSGCGGMSLGFQRQGCVSVGGVEIDEWAALSHQRAFHPNVSPALAKVHAAPKDITTTDPHDLLRCFGHLYPADTVDFLVGGPPCPTFTRVGRAKLREVHNDPNAFLNDPRSKLYVPYLRYVEALAPVGLLMENVPDFLNWGGHNLAEEICDVLEGWGYDCAYTLLNAANYGVPQMRERFFLIALHREADPVLTFPAPTHYVNFPAGYTGTRNVALKAVDPGNRGRHVPTPLPPTTAPKAVTVEQALYDLPEILGHRDGSIRRGARRFNEPVRPTVPLDKANDYVRSLRAWPGLRHDGRIWDHVIRSLSERDYRLFERMDAGDDYPKAHALAVRLFQQECERRAAEGSLPEQGTDAWEGFLREYVPPYDPGKFPNKWRKMEPDEPARTLMAHLGKDSYSHIHYSSKQARVLSVREAARLQSFPDAFRFEGTMNPAFRQIGNAVPPLLAAALADAMLGSLGLSAPSSKPTASTKTAAEPATA